MNYRFTLMYDGSRYKGWERQPGIDLTIQGKLENILLKLTGKNIEVIGAGRTDAGVHAKAMVCNAHFETDLSAGGLLDYMNEYLPDDICIKEAEPVSERFHSRYNAVGKQYRYTCYTGNLKPVFDRKYVFRLEEEPDLDKMRQAAEFLIGEHDFASFCSNPRMKKSTVRRLNDINIVKKGRYIYLTFDGTGFLQHMVRILTGTLLEVGSGLREAQSIPMLIEKKERALAGFTAPAQGLCLMKVYYS